LLQDFNESYIEGIHQVAGWQPFLFTADVICAAFTHFPLNLVQVKINKQYEKILDRNLFVPRRSGNRAAKNVYHAGCYDRQQNHVGP
jgi:hypothetical protein